MTDASRPAAGDSSGSDGTPPRAPNRHLTADEIAAGLPAGDSGAPRVNNEWVDNYAGREAEGTGRRSVERDLARDLRDCRAQLAAMTQERDEYRRHFLAVRVQRNTFEAQSIRLAADVKRLEEERDAKQAQLVLEILDRQEFEERWLRAATDVKKLRAEVLAACVFMTATEDEEKEAEEAPSLHTAWCWGFSHALAKMARVLTETEATHTERGDAHEATRDGMRLHRVPSQGGYVATGDGASVQHASSSLSMDEAACRIRDYAEQIEANERMAASSEAAEGGGENEAASGIQLEADSAAEQASARTQAATPPPSDRLRSMSLSVERTLELESQLAALREQLEWVSRWRQSPEGEAAVPIGRWPWQKIGIALSDTAAAATTRDAALREEGRRQGLEQAAALLGKKAAALRETGYSRDHMLAAEWQLAAGRVRALLATPAPPEGKP